MHTANVNRAEILGGACIVTIDNIASHPRLKSEFALAHHVLSKLAGREIYIVTWRNGITAMVDAEPGTTGWDDLLVNSYIACLQNYVAPVVGA